VLIAQGPLRISLFGGGSDLPAFLERNEGAVLSFAIDQRVYVVGHPFTHRQGILLKYSKSEDVQSASELRHPIAKVVLERYGLTDIDIAVMSDVPAGTGMGSSSSFTVAFLAFVRHACGTPSSPVDLAREACEIEIDILREPIGYQDQWASALGGINVIRFDGRGSAGVAVEQVTASAETIQRLERNLHLIPVGAPRSASELLARQGQSLTNGSKSEEITKRLVDLVDQGHRALLTHVDDLGPLLHEAWSLKREVSAGVSTPHVDEVYDRGIEAGATGGKLLGAGGSGYLAFYVPEGKVEAFTAEFPTKLPFRVSSRGAGVIHES
jgi:D-glycero-alpha-D-manno-heptose-7-phosphate kinase